MTYRVRNIGIAVALALVAALLTTFYVTNYKKSIQRQADDVQVWVATKNIPAGTLGVTVISTKMLKTQKIARSAVVPGMIASPDQIEGKIATQPIYAGEQVTFQRFGPAVQQGVRTQLSGNYRAFQLSGDSNQVLAGTLHAGDRVDVVGVIKVKDTSGSDDEFDFSRVVLRDIKVLKTSGGPAASAKLASPNGGSSWLILRVTDNQAQKLAAVYDLGEYWTLQLRPPLNATDSPQSVETAWTLLTDGLSRQKVAKALGAEELYR